MIEWKISTVQEDYLASIAFMEDRVNGVIAEQTPELIWFLEYPPLYTAGTGATMNDLLIKQFPVYHAGRGGKFTYHGPRQMIIYCVINLKKRHKKDVRRYVYNLEQIIINTLQCLSVHGERIDDKIGIWVKIQQQYKKIAAIGIRIKKWVTYYGISLNINPDLSHYNGIVPCGIAEHGITSLNQLDVEVHDDILIKYFKDSINKILLG